MAAARRRSCVADVAPRLVENLDRLRLERGETLTDAVGQLHADSLLFLDVPGEEHGLEHHEQEHEAHAPEELEVDPGIGGKIERDVEVRRAHEREKPRPAPVEAGP